MPSIEENLDRWNEDYDWRYEASPGRSHGEVHGGSGTAASILAFKRSFRRPRSLRSHRDSVA